MSSNNSGGSVPFRFAFEHRTFREVVVFSRDHLSHIAYMEIEPAEGERLHRIGMEGRLIGAASSARMWCSAGKAMRTPEHLDMGGSENVLLIMPLTVPGVFSLPNGAAYACGPGEVFVMPGDQPFEFSYGDNCTQLCVTLPRSEVRALEGNMLRTVPLAAGNGLSLLKRYSEILIEESYAPAAAALAAEHLRDLAILALGTQREDRRRIALGHASREARLAAIKADIAANIVNPALSLAWLARRHGLRPRRIQDLFYAAGAGFTEHVLGARLDRARAALADPRNAGRNVAEIALSCGFNDISWFNRTFRRRFSMTPSEARGTSRRAGQET